jgi:RNase H-like domain found in reverse transcriptase/Reverse transcriptase (RNA-dependent DNA polymerase)
MCVGATTMYRSAREMNGKQLSKWTKDFLNLLWCFSECVIPRKPFRLWGTTFSWWWLIYMDDILIFANTKEELERITKLVLEKLREHDLFLKAKKCEFCQKKIKYLGMIIKEGKISMDAVKLGGIRDWPVPTTLKQTWSFLGFGNFYWKFISHYSKLAQPLHDLTKKDKKFEWTTNCQKAFDTMKKRSMEEPVLLMPNQSKPFQIESDASKVATGAVLTQLNSNGNWHPVAFLSKTFSETERKYKIYDQELLGIIWALKKWRHYI